jgi:hypothetical protein
VTFRGVTLCLALAAAAVACSDDGEPTASTTTASTAETTTSTTAPEREPSTTTTAFDPATVEGEVEAAYLRSWDVYAEAVYDLVLDEAALAEVYAEASLETRRDEITERIENQRAAHVALDHDYRVTLVDSRTASVLDRFVNHQVLVDPVSREPIEDDPNERLVVNFQMKLIDGSWKVTFIQKVSG